MDNEFPLRVAGQDSLTPESKDGACVHDDEEKNAKTQNTEIHQNKRRLAFRRLMKRLMRSH